MTTCRTPLDGQTAVTGSNSTKFCKHGGGQVTKAPMIMSNKKVPSPRVKQLILEHKPSYLNETQESMPRQAPRIKNV